MLNSGINSLKGKSMNKKPLFVKLNKTTLANLKKEANKRDTYLNNTLELILNDYFQRSSNNKKNKSLFR